MIRASIPATPSLRQSASTGSPRAATNLPASNATKVDKPTLLMRGCLPVDLTYAGRANTAMAWQVEAVNHGGRLPSLVGAHTNAKLGTGAVGLFKVTAASQTPAVKTGGWGVQPSNPEWFVRFIDLAAEAPKDFTAAPVDLVADSDGSVMATGTAKFSQKATLTGAGDAPSSYNSVEIGFIQNVFEESKRSYLSTDVETFHGIFSRANEAGFLYEPIPAVASPYVDNETGEKNFPFVADNHVQVVPSTGAVRTLTLSDTPGAIMPLFYDPSNAAKTFLEADSPLEDPRLFQLRGIYGKIKFVSALSARTCHAPNNPVTASTVTWFQELWIDSDFEGEGKLVDRWTHRSPARHTEGIIPGGFRAISPPEDARSAGLETYGPGATEGAHEDPGHWETYQWVRFR